MSDGRLRELERRWNETGAVEDEAAWLRERVRTGDLPQRRLELAAYAGHEAARRCAPELEAPEALDEWLRGLELWQAELALWAVAEAASTTRTRGEEKEQIDWALVQTRERFLQGGMAKLADAEELQFPHTGNMKVLVLACHALARKPHYPAEDDPEVTEARRRVVERFPLLDSERWRYNHVERQGEGWVHAFRYLRSADRETRQRVPASKGWEPGLDLRPCLPERRGVLGNLILRFEDTEAAWARARGVVTSWALGPSRQDRA